MRLIPSSAVQAIWATQQDFIEFSSELSSQLWMLLCRQLPTCSPPRSTVQIKDNLMYHFTPSIPVNSSPAASTHKQRTNKRDFLGSPTNLAFCASIYNHLFFHQVGPPHCYQLNPPSDLAKQLERNQGQWASSNSKRAQRWPSKTSIRTKPHLLLFIPPPTKKIVFKVLLDSAFFKQIGLLSLWLLSFSLPPPFHLLIPLKTGCHEAARCSVDKILATQV